MTERPTLQEEHKSSKIFGAVIFITDGSGRLYVQQERRAKPATGKKAGDYSVVCETRNPGESFMENIERGMMEECGIDKEALKQIFSQDIIVWETSFMKDVWASVSVIKCKDPDSFMECIGKSADTNEVRPVGFLSRSEFEALELREGVRNIMDKFGEAIFKYAGTDTH